MHICSVCIRCLGWKRAEHHCVMHVGRTVWRGEHPGSLRWRWRVRLFVVVGLGAVGVRASACGEGECMFAFRMEFACWIICGCGSKGSAGMDGCMYVDYVWRGRAMQVMWQRVLSEHELGPSKWDVYRMLVLVRMLWLPRAGRRLSKRLAAGLMC